MSRAHPRALRSFYEGTNRAPGLSDNSVGQSPETIPSTHLLVQGRGEIVHVASCGREKKTGLRGTPQAKFGDHFSESRIRASSAPSSNSFPKMNSFHWDSFEGPARLSLLVLGIPILQLPRFFEFLLWPLHSVLSPPSTLHLFLPSILQHLSPTISQCSTPPCSPHSTQTPNLG